MAASSSPVATPFATTPATVSARAYLAGFIDEFVKFAGFDGLDNVDVKRDQLFRRGYGKCLAVGNSIGRVPNLIWI